MPINNGHSLASSKFSLLALDCVLLGPVPCLGLMDVVLAVRAFPQSQAHVVRSFGQPAYVFTSCAGQLHNTSQDRLSYICIRKDDARE
jgi:hypothetical protein